MKRKKKLSSDLSGDSFSEHEDTSSRKKRGNKSPETASTSFGAPPSISSDMNIDSDDDFQPPIKSLFNYVATPKDLFQDIKKRSGKGTSYKPKMNLPKKDKGKGKASTSSPIPATQQEAVTAPKKNKGKEKASILPPAAYNFQQDLDAPGPSTAPSYSTAVSPPTEDFDAILSAISPEEVEDFFSTFQDPVPSLCLAKPASSFDPSISETASNSNTSALAPKASGETDTDDKKVYKKVPKKIYEREELQKAKEFHCFSLAIRAEFSIWKEVVNGEQRNQGIEEG
ncbi:hypothetical protein [Parasitella parasitica]|uniref:Uncharacterized protein n=1 Tax=Parasitella parasitica TaxID=35722 RepID=A0A0B7N339_9FUNG|nr:hypothetical protein [Parasitella parasitica]